MRAARVCDIHRRSRPAMRLHQGAIGINLRICRLLATCAITTARRARLAATALGSVAWRDQLLSGEARAGSTRDVRRFE
jgi:hypothetical protein